MSAKQDVKFLINKNSQLEQAVEMWKEAAAWHLPVVEAAKKFIAEPNDTTKAALAEAVRKHDER
ncbi:MAG TPA: hypothetical protein VH877_26720 [Polyangia bacterium]|jgi:hypothetical protein|nr:hypothetical protein [Polyangia bacterium]